MAFSDENHRFWHIDLTTRAGAKGAAGQGALACFVFSGLAVLGAIFLGGSAGFSTTEGMAVTAGAGLEAVLGLVAGLRLRAGKGAYWAMAVAAFAALELIGKIAALSIGGAIITGVILVTIIQGIRGALALKNGRGFEDDDVEAFS